MVNCRNTTKRSKTVEEIIDDMTLFDDSLMSACFNKNIPATELLLRTVLKREDIRVIDVERQEKLNGPRVEGRNITLDILATDSKGRQFNAEVQQRRTGANEHRARLHSSMVDSQMLKSGQDFSTLKDSYVIFITRGDYFRKGLPLYTAERTIQELGINFQDGSHIIYVNGSYKGKDALGMLMHDFKCKRAKNMHYKELADSVEHYKEKGGRAEMSDAVMKYARDYAKEERAEALAEGRAEGHAKGKAEGKKEGERLAILRDIRSLMETLKLSATQAMDALKIGKEQQEQYLQLLENV